MKSGCLFLVMMTIVVAQNALRFTIDDFSVGQGQEVVFLLSSDQLLDMQAMVERSSFYSPLCEGLIGCSREMNIEVTEGKKDGQFTSVISPSLDLSSQGELAVSKPASSKATVNLQYDGDNSTLLDTTGLGGVDFTDGGLALSLRFALSTGSETHIRVKIHSVDGRLCTGNSQAQMLSESLDIPFTGLSGSCDLTRVGALEVSVTNNESHTVVQSIQVVGFSAPQQAKIPCEDKPPDLTYWLNDSSIYIYFFGDEANKSSEESSEACSLKTVGCVVLVSLLFL